MPPPLAPSAKNTAAHEDRAFMQRALDLARETLGLASPNPQVGCVLTRDGVILSEGAHRYDQRDHAEIVALKQAALQQVALKQATQRGLSVAGATAYVTLEPCSHHGRTGPCADALIAARIARCVVATEDPNPLVSGQGIARLRAAGIAVTVGVLQQPARELNDAFATAIQQHRPCVTLKAALSVDGYLAPPPDTRSATRPHWLTGPAARAQVQQLRHASDAILTGIGTVLADDPALTDRSGLPRRRRLLRVILDSQLRTPITSQLVRTARRAEDPTSDLLILCSPTAPAATAQALQHAGADVITLPALDDRISLPAVLKHLAERRILSVLLEAGPILNGAFLAQNLVDKAVLFYAETELGPGSLPFAQGIDSPFLFQQSLQRTTHHTFGSDACISGSLHDPWPPATDSPAR